MNVARRKCNGHERCGWQKRDNRNLERFDDLINVLTARVAVNAKQYPEQQKPDVFLKYGFLVRVARTFCASRTDV